ncbi:S1/P1 nuclease-like protein [Leptodontidium sp. 2 PMI_412]|nr:S1/P1 nuclease-like protein [Leptodontidium sp. 2 PMI_412]
MKLQSSASVLLLASGIPLCSAWGTLGHDTIAYVATNFVSSATKTYFQTILGDTSTDYLASVATWADSYRYTTAGKFSAPFHYIDALDNPPSTCGVNYSRDCGTGGCVVSAINNYTTRVKTTTLSSAERIIAAKMLVHEFGVSNSETHFSLCFSPHGLGSHIQVWIYISDIAFQFIGDIHQPLHDENLDVGGNDIDVTFDGASTNLHAIWDTAIPEKLIGGYALSDAKSWATTLTTAIKTGTYKSSASSWLTGMKLSDPVASSMIWAGDSNAYVCTTVMPKGVSPLETVDLAGDYYTGVVGVVEEQVAKAGYRLAAWLNLIATGSTGL